MAKTATADLLTNIDTIAPESGEVVTLPEPKKRAKGKAKDQPKAEQPKAETVVELKAEEPKAPTIDGLKAEADADKVKAETVEAEATAEQLAKAEVAIVPLYIALGQKLIPIRDSFDNPKKFGQYLKAAMPNVAEIAADLRSNCIWLAENLGEAMRVLGVNRPEDFPWGNPGTIRAKYNRAKAAEESAEDLEEEAEAETAGETKDSDADGHDAKAEAIAEFMTRFARMTKAGMAETMQEILTIGLDRKLKISDLEE